MKDERAATSVDRKIGQRVRTRRLEIGMSQERLAELLGITFQQVQKYEKGVNRIAASRLLDIAGALQWPVERFYDQPATHASSAADEARATPEGAQLLAAFATIKSARLRRRVVDLIRTLVDPPGSPAMACSGPRSRRRT